MWCFSIAVRVKRLFSRSLRWSRARVFSLMSVEGSRNQQQMSSHASLLFPCHVYRVWNCLFSQCWVCLLNFAPRCPFTLASLRQTTWSGIALTGLRSAVLTSQVYKPGIESQLELRLQVEASRTEDAEERSRCILSQCRDNEREAQLSHAEKPRDD